MKPPRGPHFGADGYKDAWTAPDGRRRKKPDSPAFFEDFGNQMDWLMVRLQDSTRLSNRLK